MTIVHRPSTIVLHQRKAVRVKKKRKDAIRSFLIPAANALFAEVLTLERHPHRGNRKVRAVTFVQIKDIDFHFSIQRESSKREVDTNATVQH